MKRGFCFLVSTRAHGAPLPPYENTGVRRTVAVADVPVGALVIAPQIRGLVHGVVSVLDPVAVRYVGPQRPAQGVVGVGMSLRGPQARGNPSPKNDQKRIPMSLRSSE